MTDQALDLRGFLRVVWRRRFLASVVAVLGMLIGAGLTLLYPPLFATQAIVLLPSSARTPVSTQSVVAASKVVLIGAVHRVDPPLSLEALRGMVKVRSLSPSIFQITGTGHTARQAEIVANAVADSYVDYLGMKNSAVGKLHAQIVSRASRATTVSFRNRLFITGVIGALLGLIVGSVLAVAISRSRDVVRERDDVADAMGVQVLASLHVKPPSTPSAWRRLLGSYQPDDQDAAALREILSALGFGSLYAEPETPARYCRSLKVLSLSSDPRALAVGPQLASFAASLGVRTALVVDDRREQKVTAALRTACAAESSSTSGRWPHLQVAATTELVEPRLTQVDLTVVVGVIDGRVPRVESGDLPIAALFAVAPGVTTGGELSRVAASITAAGLQIAGAIVANAASADYSTGRVPQPVGARQPTHASHLGWMTTEIKL